MKSNTKSKTSSELNSEIKPEYKTWDEIKLKRNSLLAESDWTALSDSPCKDNYLWITYRQELRDITENFSSPEEVAFPEKP